MNYGRAIRTCRVARGIAQQDLAERAKLSKGYISLIEKGEKVPSVSSLKEICKALSVPPHLMSVLAMSPEDLEQRPDDERSTLGLALLELLVVSGDMEAR